MGMSIRFTPRDSKAYLISIPLFLQGDMDKPYMQLEVCFLACMHACAWHVWHVQLHGAPCSSTACC